MSHQCVITIFMYAHLIHYSYLPSLVMKFYPEHHGFCSRSNSTVDSTLVVIIYAVGFVHELQFFLFSF